jgi:hypothetical protein
MLSVLLFYSTYFGGLLQSLRSAPVYAFLTYQAVYFFNPQGRWWSSIIFDIRYSFLTVIAMIILYLFNKKQLDTNKLFDAPQFKWIYLLLTLYSFAYFYAIDQEQHWRYLEPFISVVVIISLAYKLINSIKHLDYVLMAYIYGATYLSFITFQTGRNSGDRVEGIGMVDSPDSNGTAAALAPSLVLCIYYVWIAKNWKQRLIFLTAAAFIANALVLINSRGAFLAALGGVLYFMATLFFTKVKSKAQKLKVLAVGILGLIAAFNVMDDSFVDRMLTIKTEQVDETRESGSTRTIFWKAAIEMSYDYPFGQGAKGFNHYGPVYIPYDVVVSSDPRVDPVTARQKTVHSTWFEALTEVGYPGLITLLTLIYVSYRSTLQVKRYLKLVNAREHYLKVVAIEATLFSFIIAATFLNRLRAEIFFWAFLFTACAYNIYILQRANRSKILIRLQK